MIAAVIGEELGLVGILVTALAFAGFAVLGFRIAMRCTRPVREVPRRRRDVPGHRPGGRQPGRGAGLPAADGRPAAADKLRRLEPGRLHDPLRHPPQRGRRPNAAPSARPSPPRMPPKNPARDPERRTTVLIAAGGTAGHVVPSLAVAAELTARGAIGRVRRDGRPDRGAARARRRVSAPHLPRLGPSAEALAGARPRRSGWPAWRLRGASASCATCARTSCSAAGATSPARCWPPPGCCGSRRRCSRSTRTWASPTAWRRRSRGASSSSFPIDGKDPPRYLVTGRPVPRAVLEGTPTRAGASSTCPPTARSCSCSAAAWARPRINRSAAAAWADADPGFTVVHITGEREFAAVLGPGGAALPCAGVDVRARPAPRARPTSSSRVRAARCSRSPPRASRRSWYPPRT